MPLEEDSMKKRRDIEKDRFLIRRFLNADLRKFLTQWVISLENETIQVKQTSRSKSTNSKSNLK